MDNPEMKSVDPVVPVSESSSEHVTITTSPIPADMGHPASLKFGCCPITDTIWNNDVNAVVKKPLPVYHMSRDFSNPNIKKAIVSIDTKKIGPNDIPHHPFDSDREEFFQRKPAGLTINGRTEQIYICDVHDHKILVFGADGSFEGTFGGEGTKPGLFRKPTGIAYEIAFDRLFVVDKDNHRVQILDAGNGRCIQVIGSQGKNAKEFDCPWGIALSSVGNCFAVTDTKNARVQLFQLSGTFLGSYKTGKSGSNGEVNSHSATPASFPVGIAFDLPGANLYIADYTLYRILRLNLPTSRIQIFVELIPRPFGLAVDNGGNVLVCDSFNHQIKVFRLDGIFIGSVSTIRGISVQSPVDIAVFPSGYFALLDDNGRLSVF